MEMEQDLRNRFIPTHPLITLIIIALGFVLLPLFAFYPWAFGTTAGDSLAEYSAIFRGIFYFEIAAHTLEALVGISLLLIIDSTLSNIFKWTASILVNGGFSLRYLVKIFRQVQSAKNTRDKD